MKRPLWIHVAVCLFYAAAAILMTRQLITVIGEQMIGHPFGDTYEYTHHIWWINHALRSGQSPFFQPLLLYPNGLQAAWLWGVPLQSFPAWLLMLVMPLPVAFNLQALLTLTLNGWAMWFLSSQLLAVSDQRKEKERFEPTRREGRQEESKPSAVSNQQSALSTQYSSLSTFHLRLSTPTQSSVLSPHHFFPALLAGLVFMLYPPFQGQLAAGHTGLLVLWPIPLLMAALLRLRDGSLNRRSLILTLLAAAVCFMLSLWGSVLLLIYVLAPLLGLYAIYVLLRREWRVLLTLIIAIGLGALLSAPFVLPILREQISQPTALQEDGSVRYSAALLGIVSPSFYHPLFSSLEYPRRVLGIDPFEGAAYVGIVAAVLVLIAAWKVRRARIWLLAAVLAWVFSLGPLLKLYDSPVEVRIAGYATHISLPWALFQNLPVLSIARTPGRFNFAVGFAVAVLAGYGAAFVWNWLGKRRDGAQYTGISTRHPAPNPSPNSGRGEKRRWDVSRSPSPNSEREPEGEVSGKHTAPLRVIRPTLFVVLMALIGFEYQFFWDFPTVPAAIPGAIRTLGERENIRAVFDIPWDHRLTDKDAMYLQTGHGLPMIAGHITRTTPLNPAMGYLLQRTLDPALLNMAGVDVIIMHKQWDDEEGVTDVFLRERLGTPIYEDERFAVFDAPALTGESPGFIASIELPEAITGQGSVYFYAPQPGTVTLRGNIGTHGERRAILSLDDELILEWTVQGEIGLEVPIEIETAGYHTLTIAADPPCPTITDPALRCPVLRVTGIELGDYVPRQSAVSR